MKAIFMSAAAGPPQSAATNTSHAAGRALFRMVLLRLANSIVAGLGSESRAEARRSGRWNGDATGAAGAFQAPR